MSRWLLVLCVSGCAAEKRESKGAPPVEDIGVRAEDVGKSSGYQDFWFGQYNRGRGAVVADFDGDGDPDVFSGNPGGHSFLIRNVTEPGGELRFEPWQILSHTELFYGGVAADFDNDGDVDLFVATGANDGFEADRMYRNDGDSEAPLVDISGQMSLVPTTPGDEPVPNGTMGARAFDANRDGRLDLWASNYAPYSMLSDVTIEDKLGLNQVYLNHGDFDFEERGWELKLRNQDGTRHSAIFDYDLDGDFDIYENNFVGQGTFWENQLVELGSLEYEAVTKRISLGEGRDLTGAFLNQAMCSIPVDLDNDGWEDLLILHRGNDNDPELAIPGHQVFMNQAGTGFVDVLEHTGLSARFDERPILDETGGPMGAGWGVMGCQVGDVNLDGYPDVFIGTGVGQSGDVDRLFVSSGRKTVPIEGVGEVTVPLFDEWTALLDFPVDPVDGAPEVTYPYRTHGSAFADFDGDGIPELAVHNGGPAIWDFLEPNRLWKFHHEDPRFLRVTVVGNASQVNLDGVGTRVRVTVERDADGARWDLWQTRRAGTGFGAQNEPQLTFGLADADRVVAVEVHWPDGTVEQVDPPEGTQARLTVAR